MLKCNFPDFTRIHMEIRYEKLNHGNFGGRSLDEFIRHQTISECWRNNFTCRICSWGFVLIADGFFFRILVETFLFVNYLKFSIAFSSRRIVSVLSARNFSSRPVTRNSTVVPSAREIRTA